MWSVKKFTVKDSDPEHDLQVVEATWVRQEQLVHLLRPQQHEWSQMP